VKVDFAK